MKFTLINHISFDQFFELPTFFETQGKSFEMLMECPSVLSLLSKSKILMVWPSMVSMFVKLFKFCGNPSSALCHPITQESD